MDTELKKAKEEIVKLKQELEHHRAETTRINAAKVQHINVFE